MDLARISDSDLLGRFFIWESGVEGITGYYQVIKHLQPLFDKLKSQERISGFYVNRIRNGHKIGGETQIFDSARLSYFVPMKSISAAIGEIKNFLDENKLVESSFRECPHHESNPLEFMRFLALNTAIGLDIMKINHQNAVALLSTYRFQVFPTRSSAQLHLEPTFERDSATYQQLSYQGKSFYWEYFPRCDKLGVWAHHLVNLVIGFDNPRYSYGEPYSIQRINREFLEPINAPLISEDWKSKTTAI